MKTKSGDKTFPVIIYDCLWPKQNKTIKSRSVCPISNSRFYIFPLFSEYHRPLLQAPSTNFSSRDNLQLPAKVNSTHLAQLPRPQGRQHIVWIYETTADNLTQVPVCNKLRDKTGKKKHLNLESKQAVHILIYNA